jgi:hypothetical protein
VNSHCPLSTVHCPLSTVHCPLSTNLMLFQSPHIPLAVYRELAAHLQQIDGVTVEFLQPSQERAFSYLDSQLAGLEVHGVNRLVAADRARLDLILSYYADRYDRLAAPPI